MGFVQASMLAALGAVVLPILAHLVFRRRSRPVDLGTLRFLKKAVRKDTRRRKLKRWVLLALRLGCVVFLVLLFARPFRAEFLGGGDKGLTVILIDRSASMAREHEGERLVDRALGKVPDIAARVAAGSRVEVAWFDMKAEPIETSEDGRVSLDDLESPENLTGGTDYAAALNWAAARCAAARGGGPLSVHVITDLQQTGFGTLEEFAFPEDIPIRVWDIDEGTTQNVAVTEVRPINLMVRADQPTTVQATILNARTEALEGAPVGLRLVNGSKIIELPAVASAEPGASATVTFETPPLVEGLWEATVSVTAEDGLRLDNVRHAALYAAAKPRVLLLDGAARDVAALGEAYFLEAALRLAPQGETIPDGPFQVIVIPYRAGDRIPDLDEVDVLIAANVESFPPGDEAEIRAFLARGGSAVVFGGGNLTSGSDGSYTDAGLSVGEIIGTHLTRDVPFRVTKFAEEHPVLGPFSDPQHGDIRRLTFSGCTKIEPSDGAQVLARFRDGTPLILERRTGSSRILWCTASVGREHGDWSRNRLFLPLVHQLIRGATGIVGGGPVRELPGEGSVPGVREIDGVWEVRNLEPQESELDACTPEEFAERLGVTLSSSAVTATTSETTGEKNTDLRPGELWPWFWLMLVVCLLAEGLLADRTVA